MLGNPAGCSAIYLFICLWKAGHKMYCAVTLKVSHSLLYGILLTDPASTYIST
jgi:hypothetical protein